MRNNPERVAWVVLLSSFFVCVALGVTTPLSVRWYIRNAQINHDVRLQIQRGPLSVVYGGHGQARSVSDDNSDITPGSVVRAPNSTSGQLVIQTPQSRGSSPIATVQLYDQTECILSSAHSPRFSTSHRPHKVILEMKAGRARINVFGDNDRSTVVEVGTDQGLITLGEGSYEVKINSATEATVRYGQASVVSESGDAVSLGPQERARLTANDVEGPLPAARNLIENGDFEEPLVNGWESYEEQTDPDLPPGRVQIVTTAVDNEERAVVEFYRDAVNHAEVGITQQIDYDVRDFASLELHMAVNVASQNILGFGGCGSLGSECPVIVRIEYEDIYDTDREWLHGFYTGQPAEDWPLKGWQERLEVGTWQPYSSGNLMEELAETLPAHIQSVTIYASGHSFDAMATEMELLAQE